MKKSTLLLAMAMFALGLGINVAQSELNNNIAVVDVSSVVAKSSQVQILKKEQENKTKELRNWLETARNDIQKQQTQEGKEKLTKKYDAELIKKQNDIKDNYAKKLKEIDKSISSIISNEAKNRGYSIVISKSAVLYGGDDITNVVAKAVK